MPILHSFGENKLKYEDEDEAEIKMMGTGMDKEPLEHNLYENDITLIIYNIMDEINIDDLTIEQYLRLTQEHQTPSMVKKVDDMTIAEYTEYEERIKGNTLIDASNNIMPKSIYEYLKLVNHGGAAMSVEMDDMTQQETLETVKNVLIKINKFEFPCDFVVTDMLENLGEIIMLGRPFLEIIHAQIDVFQEEISLGIGEDKIKFDVKGNPCRSDISIENFFMANTSQEEESFNPLEIRHDLFLYESPACLQFEQDTRNYTIDPQNKIARQTNPLLDKGGLTKRWHVCKPIQMFYDDGSGKDCGTWPTCDPDSNFLQVCYGNQRFNDATRERRYYEWVAQNYEFDNNKTPSTTTIEAFMDKFQTANGMFLPYLISDHSPAILWLPNGMARRKKAFRFSNFVTDKKEFLPTVKKDWEVEVEGHMLYKVVKKMKLMKPCLNNLSWKDGNIFERVTKLRECLKNIQAEVDKYPHNEDIKVKTKIEWLKDGDRNTEFFHKIIKGRMHKGRIVSVCNEKGERFENDQVAEQFVKHFQEFLGKKDVVTEMPKDRIVFPNKLSIEETVKTCKDVSEVEVKNAMFDIEDSKAPGPDAVKDFFVNGKLLGEVNATIIPLVLKVPNPDRVSEFRPIACYNVIYKCISKIVTNRLKGELFKGYYRKQKIKKVAFKIDLQKAYDTIKWDFLRVVLEQFGFPKKMVKWIMVCVSTTKFSININEEREGYFSGGRGLRQGVLHHKSVNVIKKALEEFSSYSGLKANMSKSTVFFGGLTNAEQKSILDIVPFAIGRPPMRYLGVPLLTKKINAIDCKPLVEKVKDRVLDWRNKALSYSGRPQEHGGLGIKNLQVWNEVILVKQLWNVIAKKDTFWVNWINTEYLKGKSVWVVTAKASSSPICDIVTTREIYEARLNIDTTMTELVAKYEGTWPDGWSNEYPILKQCGMLRIHDGTRDKAVWLDRNGKENLFSVKQVWKDLNYDETKVDWYKIVWFTKNIPRHAFVLWMAIQNRLSTQDRIVVWKPNEVMQCVFCKQCLDSVEHLFFQCAYTKQVWKEAQRLLSVSLSFSWNEIVEELERLPNNQNVWSIVRRLMFGAVVYYTWQERNNRVFREEKRDEKTLIQTIKEIVQLKIAGFVVKESKWKIDGVCRFKGRRIERSLIECYN
ncbi:RNA-directed DNA polymerase, eukaryota, reverse transcriptase zinc-binding domain protein [Tanacetum coccineum]|uniref:RNA-directed DNA polymerase, eukaryota, reverse transcriptase zinc-binding domain protein n=1 Tax=Tanacetum coccineum TaxID=301880 RepID=A0ABQ5HP64_9ASTR